MKFVSPMRRVSDTMQAIEAKLAHFKVTELNGRDMAFNYYSHIRKPINSDYIKIFKSVYNPKISFAFAFNNYQNGEGGIVVSARLPESEDKFYFHFNDFKACLNEFKKNISIEKLTPEKVIEILKSSFSDKSKTPSISFKELYANIHAILIKEEALYFKLIDSQSQLLKSARAKGVSKEDKSNFMAKVEEIKTEMEKINTAVELQVDSIKKVFINDNPWFSLRMLGRELEDFVGKYQGPRNFKAILEKDLNIKYVHRAYAPHETNSERYSD